MLASWFLVIVRGTWRDYYNNWGAWPGILACAAWVSGTCILPFSLLAYFCGKSLRLSSIGYELTSLQETGLLLLCSVIATIIAVIYFGWWLSRLSRIVGWAKNRMKEIQ